MMSSWNMVRNQQSQRMFFDRTFAFAGVINERARCNESFDNIKSDSNFHIFEFWRSGEI